MKSSLGGVLSIMITIILTYYLFTNTYNIYKLDLTMFYTNNYLIPASDNIPIRIGDYDESFNMVIGIDKPKNEFNLLDNPFVSVSVVEVD